MLWFGPHAALTTVFTPFVAGMHASDSTFEVGHQCKLIIPAGHCSLTPGGLISLAHGV